MIVVNHSQNVAVVYTGLFLCPNAEPVLGATENAKFPGINRHIENAAVTYRGVFLCPDHDLTRICRINQQEDKVRKSHLYLERR